MQDTSMSQFQTLTSSFSSKILITANVIPLIGVLFFAWNLNFVLILYWVENIIIGIFNLVKMLTVSGENIANRLFKSAFFLIHYGGFCAAHGLFLLTFLEIPLPEINSGSQKSGFILIKIATLIKPTLDHLRHLFGNPFLLSVSALFVSHGFSLIENFYIKKEQKLLKIKQLFSMPYPRIIVLHITIIAGGFLVDTLGSPISMLAVLVCIKIVIDLKLHQREHKTIQEY